MSDCLLPEEILIEILVKLPVESLIRFTSVCKQWRYLIRTPFFISSHLSNTTQSRALLLHYDIRELPEYPLLINSDSELQFQIGCFNVVGSCDGLVCLSDPECIIIWNPAIRTHVVLPQPLHLVNPYNGIGFGVASDVYKVVTLVYCSELLHAEVYCLGGGEGSWRKLTGYNDVRVRHLTYFCSIFFKGFVHWIALEWNSVSVSILTFHVDGEVFGELVLPEELERWTGLTHVSLSIIGGSLGAIKYDWMSGDPRCDVWTMKDYGVKDSWTKLFTIDTVKFSSVIGFRGSDEVVLALDGCEVVTYNPETKGVKHVDVERPMQSFYVDGYKESLVLPGGG